MKQSVALTLVILLILAFGCSSQKNSVAAQYATDGDVFDQIADGQQPTVIASATVVSTTSQNSESIRLYIITDSEPDAYDSLEAYVRDKCEFFYIEYSSVADWKCRYDVGNENIADAVSDAIKAGYTDIILDSFWYSYEEVDKLVSAYPDVQFYFDDGKGYYDEEPEDTYEEAYEESNADVTIEWKNVEFSFKDNQGYSFVGQIKLSPWILLSNTSLIEEAWKEVSKNVALPSYDSWGVRSDIGGLMVIHAQNYNNALDNYSECSHGISDMYYCIGSLTIRNTTNGWPISEQNARDLVIRLRCESDEKRVRYSGKYFGCTAGRVMYSNKTDTFVDGIRFLPHMAKDTFTVPFVLMTAEVFTPNTPNGGYYDFVLNHVVIGGVQYNTEQELIPETRVGVIGKDKKLALP